MLNYQRVPLSQFWILTAWLRLRTALHSDGLLEGNTHLGSVEGTAGDEFQVSSNNQWLEHDLRF